MKKGLGRLQAPDERDALYPFKTVLAADKPRTERYYKAGPILDQGLKPWCVEFMWRQWASSAPVMQGINLPEGVFYAECQLNDEWAGENYDGTSVRAGAKVLTKRGLCKSYVWAHNVTDMKEWLLRDLGTICAGTNWYRKMFDPDESGYVEIGGPIDGGHAWFVIGYSTKRDAFRCINSWGRDWGQEGRFWIRSDAMQQLLDEDGEACAAVQFPVKPLRNIA